MLVTSQNKKNVIGVIDQEDIDAIKIVGNDIYAFEKFYLGTYKTKECCEEIIEKIKWCFENKYSYYYLPEESMSRRNRKLDGVYFRIKRDDKWDHICFSDLTEEEMNKVLEGRDAEWLKSLCIILGQDLREIGDYFDINCGLEVDGK